MRTYERGFEREGLDNLIAAAAHTYGFCTPPIQLTKKEIDDVPEMNDHATAPLLALCGKIEPATETTQVWATTKRNGQTSVVFAVSGQKIAIAQSFVVKAALATAESAGFSDLTVLVSSVGDQESRRRHLRELGNFFKKHVGDIPEDVLALSVKNPDRAAHLLREAEHPIEADLPRTIDFLSEASRKIMLETIALFEKLGIRYELDPRLPYTPDVNRELVFAIVGTDKKGNVMRIASGGRFMPPSKKDDTSEVMGMNVLVPKPVDIRKQEKVPPPACFVIHIGEAAKLKSFMLLDALWHAQVSLGQALLEETVQAQMQRANASSAKYLAIIGQREALDDTVIVKNVSTQIQETIPFSKLSARMNRVRA